jgi:hypothetical protein
MGNQEKEHVVRRRVDFEGNQQSAPSSWVHPMISHEKALQPMDLAVANESSASAVSWAAILAGAVVAAAVSLLLVILGTGLGFASLSPWSNEGPSAKTFTLLTAIWLIVVQWIASGLGGYLTGRLRTKWVGAHTHEVFFRDTAHGFVTWAVATLVTSAIVAAVASSAVSGGAKAAGSLASAAAQAGATAAATPSAASYEIDSLFRSTSTNATSPEVRAEATRILAQGIGQGELSPADRTYLVEVISARTGVSQQEAAQRLDNAISQLKAAELKAKQTVDAARKAASAASFFAAFSMLIGAFIASVAAAYAGGLRDD